MSQFKYKEFTGSIDPSVEDDCLFGQILYINDCIIYEGQTIPELKAAFEASVDNYLEYCARHNKEPAKPFSGSFNVRVTPDLHREASIYASKLGVSLNVLVGKAINQFILAEQTNLVNPVPNFINWSNLGVAANQQPLTNQPQVPGMNKAPLETYTSLIAPYTTQH